MNYSYTILTKKTLDASGNKEMTKNNAYFMRHLRAIVSALQSVIQRPSRLTWPLEMIVHPVPAATTVPASPSPTKYDIDIKSNSNTTP